MVEADAAESHGPTPGEDLQPGDGSSAPSVPGNPAERGGLQVAPRVVERVASHVTLSVPGVGHDKNLPRVQVVLSGGHVTLTVDVAVTWPSPAAEVAARVRHAVATTVAELTPFIVDRVDVRVRSMVAAAASERVL